jgi:hypothetical protein
MHSYDAWQVQNLRVTVFVAKAAIETQQRWWQALFETPAEKITSQPKQFLHEEQGSIENGRLSLSIQPGRIDWRLIVPFNLTEAIDHISTIGHFSEALSIFTAPMNTWFTICPPFRRIAFGATLIQPTNGHASAYQLLSKYLHSVRLDPRSSDFSYQINFPRESKLGIPGLRINRLMRWNALRMQLELATPESRLEPPPPRYASGLELDINTVPEFSTENLSVRYSEMFSELVDLAKEIAEKGEIQ